MGRIAGDDRSYKLRFCRVERTPQVGPRGGKKPDKQEIVPTEHGIDLPSVTTIVKAVWGNTFTQAAYWGYNIAIQGFEHILEQNGLPPNILIKESLKAGGHDPNTVRNKAADRGLKAHDALEHLSKDGEWKELDVNDGYSLAAMDFYDKEIKGRVVQSERLVFHLPLGYCGTCDLALSLGGSAIQVCDAKTHAPSSKQQASYTEDRIQVAAYAVAFEWMWDIGIHSGSVVLLQEDGSYIFERFPLDTYKKLWYNTLEAYKLIYGKGAIY